MNKELVFLEHNNFNKKVINIIRSNLDSTQNSNFDKISTIFQSILSKDQKKLMGQFYTPQEIVDYIIDIIQIDKTSKVLDLSCGAGAFLIKALQKSNNVKNIYGVDINNIAVQATILNLWLNSKKTLRDLKIITNNIKHGNSVRTNEFDWHKEFSNVMQNGGFDVIIGNPPYVTVKKSTDFDIKDSIFNEVVNGTVNCATLMVARSFELLKKNGMLGFLLPKSMLRVESYKKIRDYVLNNTSIVDMFDIGQVFSDVRGEQFILILKKTSDKNLIKKNKVRIGSYLHKNRKLLDQPNFLYPQKKLFKFSNFPIFNKKYYYTLSLKLINGYKNLDEHSRGQIFRGISLGANSKDISNNYDAKKERVLRGDSLDKFAIKYFIYANTDFLKSKFGSKYKKLKQNKIVLQNIFSSESGIISTYDNNGVITLDTVTNIFVDRPLYILGLLNSNVVNFFMIYTVYNKSFFTMHTDKTYLGKIPIPDASINEQKEIESIVKDIIECKKSGNVAKLDILYSSLNNKIYKIYELSNEETSTVIESLNSIWKKKVFNYGRKNE